MKHRLVKQLDKTGRHITYLCGEEESPGGRGYMWECVNCGLKIWAEVKHKDKTPGVRWLKNYGCPPTCEDHIVEETMDA